MDCSFLPVTLPAAERNTRIVSFVALGVGAAVLIVPFWPWVVMATWLSTFTLPLVRPLERRMRGRRRAAAVVTVCFVLVVGVPLVLATLPLLADANALVRRLLHAGDARTMLETLVSERTKDLDGATTTQAWRMARSVAGATGRAFAGIAVFVVTFYARLAHGSAVMEWLEAHVPLAPPKLARMTAAFMETGRGLLVGAGGAGLAQGAIATALYAIVAVPHAFALGVLTLLAALIPGIGTGLVWGPIAVGLALTGRPGAALAVAITGFALIGTIDNVLKPMLARYGRLTLPAPIVFVSMLGGLVLVGLEGILLGPLLVRLAVEALRLAREERTHA